MRWYTHTSIPLAAGALYGLPESVLAGLALGCVLPDTIDMLIAGRDQKRFQRIHRESSHWAGWFVLLLLIAFAGNDFIDHHIDLASLSMPADLTPSGMLVGLSLGALSHVILDALNPSGVPIGPMGGKPRLALNLISTGTWQETVFLAASLLLLGAINQHSLERIARQLVQSFF